MASSSTNISSSSDIPSAQPPHSSPGHEDPTAGIPEGEGGLSSTAYIESPVGQHDSTSTGEEGTGLVASLKNMLGLGGAESKTEENEQVHAEDKAPAENAGTYAPAVAAGTATAGAAAVGTGTYLSYHGKEHDSSSSTTGTTSGSNTTTLPDRSIPPPSAAAHTDPIAAPAPTSEGPSTSTRAETDQTAPPPSTASHTDPIAPTASSLPSHTQTTTSSSAKGSSEGSNNGTNDPHQKSDHKPPVPASTEGEPNTSRDDKKESSSEGGEGGEGHASKNKGSSTRENVDSIPTAGGERLGDKHWGESKIVPEDPGPQGGEKKGVSSKDGQPSDEVRDNTAKNTGGATGGPNSDGQDGEGKEKLMDKVKDKLHMGKK